MGANMKKLIPVIVALVLILLVAGGWAGFKLLDRYTYSKDRASLEEYYGVGSEQEAAVILQDEILPVKAAVQDGVCYLDLDSIHKYLNKRFYEDAEGLLIYSLPDDVVQTVIGSAEYSSGYYTGGVQAYQENFPLSYYQGEGDNRKLYIALDYVKKYTNFEYELFTGPNRILMRNKWPEVTLADIKKNTSVRYQGGVKSEILKDVQPGDTVQVLEAMEKWSKVKTQDGIIGYVENKRLTNERMETPQAQSVYMEPEYANVSKDYKISLAWHQVTNQSANATLAERVAQAKSLNTISPTWYSISDTNGNFTSLASQDYVNTAHQLGLEVWALIDDFNKEVDTKQTLASWTSRTNLIQGLIREADTLGLDGINIDFEQVEDDGGEAFIQFIRELSIPCRARGIVLSVDNYVPKEHSAHYNRAEQGVVADYVIIMGYDEHWGGGGVAGSVASIDFVEEGIKNTLAEVPAEKVINAVPFYTRVWKTEAGKVTSEAVGMDTAQAFLERNALASVWDETTCQNYAEGEIEGGFYQVWLEDEQSLQVKLNVMQVNNLAGVGAWKLGFERPSAWDVIAAYVNGQ